MNKTLFFAGLFLVILSGCSTAPTANFSMARVSMIAGESLQFINSSFDAESYVWNFGDGITSSDFSPTHTYASSGTYHVSLTAFSKREKKSDEFSLDIFIGPTAIEIANTKLQRTWSLDSLTLTQPGGPNYSFQLADLWGGTTEYLNVFAEPDSFKSYRDGVEEYSGTYSLTSTTEIRFDNQLNAPILELTDNHLTYQRPSANDPNYTETWYFTKQ